MYIKHFENIRCISVIGLNWFNQPNEYQIYMNTVRMLHIYR